MNNTVQKFRSLAAQHLRLARATRDDFLRARRVEIAQVYKFLAHDEERIHKAPERSRPKEWESQHLSIVPEMYPDPRRR